MKQALLALTVLFSLISLGFSQGLQPEDWYRLDRLSDVQISPDGKRIAFVVTRADKEKQRNVAHVWMVASDGRTPPLQFTNGPQNDTHPRWSPDGKHLAFLSSRGENERPQIFIMLAAGGEAIRLTQFDKGVSDLVWSPDSARFAVVSRVGKTVDKKDPLSGVVVIRHARYDLDGRGFLKDERSHIFVVDARTGEAKQITDGAEWDDTDPAWSPDSKWIAFVSDRTGRAFEGSRNTDVFIVSAEGGTARRVSPHEEANGNPAFSPDGKSIAFTGVEREGDQPDVWIMPVEGGPALNLTESFDERIGRFVWTDKGIFFTTGFKGETPLFNLGVATKKVEMHEGKGSQLNSFSISDSGEIALIKNGFMNPGDVYIGSRRVTDFNRELLRERGVLSAEEFWFKSDGRDIHEWFVKPLKFEPGKKYPLILRIHGGPAGMYGINFDHEVQTLAARGYAVVFLNPRGSSGYGQKFVRANHKDWGGGDYRDIMKGVDTVLEKYGWIDPKRMAVYGCSYGGYMTNWIITQTHRFAAAAPECTISNLISLYGTTDGAFGLENSFGGSIWETYDLFWDRSPIKHAHHVKTPSLFIHAEEDERTPPEQTEQMFRALRRQGVDAEFVRYPGESHGTFQNGKPAHYVDRINRILAWFDQYTH